jgi:hypothetical protein
MDDFAARLATSNRAPTPAPSCPHRGLTGVLAVATTNAFTLDQRRFPGVWNLTYDTLPCEQDVRSRLSSLVSDEAAEDIPTK